VVTSHPEIRFASLPVSVTIVPCLLAAYYWRLRFTAIVEVFALAVRVCTEGYQKAGKPGGASDYGSAKSKLILTAILTATPTNFRENSRITMKNRACEPASGGTWRIKVNTIHRIPPSAPMRFFKSSQAALQAA